MLKDDIKAVLDSIVELKTNIYQDAYTANIDLEDATFPASVFLLIPLRSYNKSKAVVKEKAQINLVFLNMNELDLNGDEIDSEVIEPMRDLAYKFLLLARDSSFNILDENIDILTVRDENDVNTSGVSFSFVAEEKQGRCVSTLID